MNKNRIFRFVLIGTACAVVTVLLLVFLSGQENENSFPTFQSSDTVSFSLAELAEHNDSFQAALLNDEPKDAVVQSVKLRNAQDHMTQMEYHIDTNTDALVLNTMRSFAPGLYTLVVEILDPVTQERMAIEQDFAWGVLAMNADKDQYQKGDIAALHFGVLDDAGKIICDAELTLTITKPNQEVLLLTTSDKSIAVTGSCGRKEAYLVDPDYEAFIAFDQLGTYSFDLVAETENGTRSIRTTIEAVENPLVTIQRKAATRLWPEAPSTMEITVTFHKAFHGTITDILPGGFEIIEASPRAQGTVTSGDGTGTLFWTGSWASGERATFQYTYDAPDISPQFYLIGPLTLDPTRGETYRENRSWHIANDDTSTKTPSSVTSGLSGEVAWVNASSGATNNDSNATVGLSGPNDQDDAQKLVATQYGFSLAAGSTINGVSATIRKYYVETGDPSEAPVDTYVRLVISGTGAGTNKSVGAALSKDTERADTYGGAADTWGNTLTEAIVEATDFGLAYGVNQPGGVADESQVRVDAMELTVTYTPPVGAMTITGRVYSTDAPSGLLASRTVNVSFNGSTNTSTDDTDAGGMYSIVGVTMTAGTLVTLYLDGETEKAVTVTLGSGSNMTGMNLYASHLILRSESGSVNLNNTYLANADNNGDSDITTVFNVTDSTLRVGDGIELFVLGGETFAPAGRVKTHDVDVRGTMTMDTYGLTVSGSLVTNAGTFSTSTGIYLIGTDDSETVNFGSNTVAGNIILDSGLVGYWKLDEASGLIAKDSSRYGYDGTLSFGTGTWSTSTSNAISFYNPHSIEFFGATAVNVGDTYLLDFGAGDFTLSAWVYNDTQTRAQAILAKDAGGARQIGMTLNVNESSAVEAGVLAVYYSGGSIYIEATTSSAVSASTWTHVLAKRKAGSTTLWVNGSQQSTSTNGGTEALPIASEVSPLYIGNRHFATSQLPFDGKIDDVRIYNRALADSEIARLAAGNQDTGSGVYELGANLDLNANLRIYGSTLDASGSTINISGNWYNVGGFTKRSGTVTFDGTSQMLSGSTVFNNFTKSVAAADSMYFDWKGRQSISGALVLNGAASQLLTLRSTNAGSGWNILLDSAGTQTTVRHADVQDSDATGGQQLICFVVSESCIDSGNNTNWLFTRIGTGTIKGTLWNDLNGDRVKDAGETTGFSGISVSLTGTITNGSAMSSGSTTNAQGQYFFSGALVSNPSGYTATVASVPTGYLKTTALSTGSLVLGTGGLIIRDFGFVQASTISGAVFLDLDQDGLIDGAETTRFESAVLTISGTSASGNTVTGSQTTNSSGLYNFRNLGPGNGSYTVSISSGIPVGYSAKLFTSSGISIAQGNTHITTANFGYLWYGMMSGVVFIDSDEDGVRDAGETTGVSSVTITVTGETTTGAVLNRTTTTTSTGAFNFYSVPMSSGSYTVSITTPSGYALTTASSFNRTIAAGTYATSAKFGLATATTITGKVFTNQGVTAIGSGKKVSLSVSGSLVTSSGFTVTGGQYTISTFQLDRGDVMTVFLDDETENAALVTIGTGSNMTGVHLYGDRLLIRSMTGGTITSAHVATADNSADSDITGIFTAASAAAVTVSSSFETFIWTGTTYLPSGTFSGGDIEIDGTWNSGGAIIARDIQADGTFTPGSTINSRNLTISGSLTAGGSITASGVVVPGTLTTSSNALTANRLTASGTLTLGASVVIVRGSWNTGDATFTTSGHVHLRGTGSTTYSIARGSSAFQHLTTSGSYSLASTLDVNGNYTLSGGTLNVSSNNYKITVAGDWHNAAGSEAFTANSGSVVLDGYGSAQRVTGSTRFNKLTKTGSVATSLTFSANQRQFFSGSLVLKGAADQLLTIQSTASGTKANIALIGSGVFRQDLDYLDVQDSDAGSGSLLRCLATDNGCENSGNNTNWLFSASCGDAIVNSPESCDEGNSNSNAANATCRTDCTAQRCGDGVVDTGESCDDGNSDNTDACLNSCALPSCGDGYVKAGDEQCEPPDTATCASNCIFRTGGGGNNGNNNSSFAAQSYSRRSAPPAGCGNGVTQANLGEECDEGVYNGVGTCSYECKQYYCGDGVISRQINEDCEPPKVTAANGQTVFASQTCGKICSLPTLTSEGGIVGGCKTIFLPECGLSSFATSSAVSSFTPAAQCGNGTVEFGEECDGDDSCNEMCRWNICGDGVVNQEGEECDNGSICENDPSRSCRSDADCPESLCMYDSEKDPLCSAVCSNETGLPSAPQSVCGDGFIADTEECDDGNASSGDGCSVFCQEERQEQPGTQCGNSVVEPGEQCDQGGRNSDTAIDMCRMDCSLPTCGDSITDTGEQCDQGSLNSSIYGDRCRRDCRLPRCGDGIIDSDEYCDGGITCKSDCSGIFGTMCGNGRIDRGEECDDANRVRGDGCDLSCRTEEFESGVRPAAPHLQVRPRLPVKVKPALRSQVRPAAPKAEGLPSSPLLPTVTGSGSGVIDPIVAGSVIIAAAAGLFLFKKKRTLPLRRK